MQGAEMTGKYTQLGRFVRTMKRDILSGEIKLEELLKIYIGEIREYIYKNGADWNDANLTTYITRFEDLIELFETDRVQCFREEFERIQLDSGFEFKIIYMENNYDPDHEIPERDRSGNIGKKWRGSNEEYDKEMIMIPGSGRKVRIY